MSTTRIPSFIARSFFCLLAAASLALGQGIDLQRAAKVAVAYGVKIYGGNVFLAGRSLEAVKKEEFAPDTPLDRMLGPLLSVQVDADAKTIRVRALGQEAIGLYREGLGVTIAPGGDLEPLRAQSPGLPPLDPSRRERPWPLGDLEATAELPSPHRERLAAALEKAFAEPSAKPRLRTRAVLVVHRGKIVGERYAEGFGRDTRLLGWSMAKTVTGALVGLAIAEGKLELSTRDLVREWRSNSDPRGAIRVLDLLRMSSGLRWNEDYADLEAEPASMLFLEEAAGRFAATSTLDHKPGERFQYSSGTTNILCEALRERFESTPEFLAWPRRVLFEPAGLDSMVLEPDPSGSFVGSSFAWATARDWARLGLLYLNDGMVAGQRVLPEGWVQKSREPSPVDPRYGLHLWVNGRRDGKGLPVRWPLLPADAFQASGYQAQKVTVIPSREVVIVRLGLTKERRNFKEYEFIQGILAALPETASGDTSR